jgi:hypothetical protein
MVNRNDKTTAQIIEDTLFACEYSSPIDMAWELVEKGVSVEVALRVLARPRDRRHCGEVKSMAVDIALPDVGLIDLHR